MGLRDRCGCLVGECEERVRPAQFKSETGSTRRRGSGFMSVCPCCSGLGWDRLGGCMIRFKDRSLRNKNVIGRFSGMFGWFCFCVDSLLFLFSFFSPSVHLIHLTHPLYLSFKDDFQSGEKHSIQYEHTGKSKRCFSYNLPLKIPYNLSYSIPEQSPVYCPRCLALYMPLYPFTVI